jgi:hypothetical protein
MAADLVGGGVHDDVVSVRVADVEHRTLLAFLSSGCLTCRAFWDAFSGSGPLGIPDDVRVVVVTKGPDEESLSAIEELAPERLPVVMSTEAWHDYSVPGSPYFVLADGPTSRVVGEGTGASWPQVLGLVAQSSADGERAEARNETRIDRELLAAGVRPGDRSLYHAAGDATG